MNDTFLGKVLKSNNNCIFSPFLEGALVVVLAAAYDVVVQVHEEDLTHKKMIYICNLEYLFVQNVKDKYGLCALVEIDQATRDKEKTHPNRQNSYQKRSI